MSRCSRTLEVGAMRFLQSATRARLPPTTLAVLHSPKRWITFDNETPDPNRYYNVKERMHLVSHKDDDLDSAGGNAGDFVDDDVFEVEDETPVEVTEAEEKTFDYTSPSKVAKLDRSFDPRRTQKRQYLTPSERQVLTKMIFDRFYLQEGEGPNDRAMWFQAGLEVEWLEEWAEQKVRADMKREGPTEANRTIPYTDRIRQEVKKAVIQRHDLYKPLAYIIGNQPFFSCEIECVPPLLCPRPETELWTHWVVQTVLKSAADHDKPIRVLDMCCGTGCIGVAIAKNCPQAEVVAVDILEKAVEVSNRNARRNGIPEARYQAKQSDMFDLFLEKESPTDGKRKVRPEYEGTFDVLVSNPPYILPDQYVDLPISVTHWESKLALVGDDAREHKQYTYFQELTDYGSSLLKKRVDRDVKLGILPNIFIEIGLQGHVVASIMERSGLFTDVLMHQDYAGQERWISANSSH